MQIRREIIPAWLKAGGRHHGVARPPAAPCVPIVDIRGFGDPNPLSVAVNDPALELRTAPEIEQLRSRLRQIRKQSPGQFSDGGPLEIPDPLPEGWTIEDVLGGDFSAESEETTHQEFINLLAFYVSPRRADYRQVPWSTSEHASTWGIYLHASGIESLARKLYLPVGYGQREALGFAAGDLLNHELQHALYDLAVLTVEAGEGPRAGLGQHHLVHGDCDLEEATCHASMIRVARARGMGPGTKERSATKRLEQWASSGPAGYRDWHRYVSDDAHTKAGRTVVGHDGLDPRLAWAMLDFTTIVSPPWLPDIPVWLILDHGTQAAAGCWAL